MNLKKIILILMLGMTSANARTYVARVTYYWDGYKTSTGAKPKINQTIAVDPRIIPYHSKIYIPKMGKTYIAQDTGSAVKSRRASHKLHRKNIVVDIYCKNRKQAQGLIKKYPMFMEVNVL